MLPDMVYKGSPTKTLQVQFGGYDHTLGAGEGTLWDMENLTADNAPLLSARPPRRRADTIVSPGGVGELNGLYWVSGTHFYYQGVRKGSVSAGEKIFAAMGARIIIFPDKVVYHTELSTFEAMEASVTSARGGVSFQNGTIYGEEAHANTLYCPGTDLRTYFAEGDAVTISGCTKHPENNKSPIVREISEDGHTLRFYENVFTLDGTDTAPTAYTEPGAITLSRTVPDMDHLCVNENRLWGCKGDTIYCSKLGDPKNFNVFDGVNTDSWSVESGSAGDFTACFSYKGYPCFFKEDQIYKVYGSVPTNFEVLGSATLGVAHGSGRSLAVAGETLFYLSPRGPVAYGGGVPTSIAAPFGSESYHDGVGGSDGMKYYLSMKDSTGNSHLFCCTAEAGLWHREDGSDALGFARWEGSLYMLLRNGELWRLDGGGEGAGEGAVSWMAEFNDFTAGSPNAKGYGKLQLRLALGEGAHAALEVRYDSRGEWIELGYLEAGKKRTELLTAIPRRSDHYRLRLTGRGECVIYSLTRSFQAGSDQPLMS